MQHTLRAKGLHGHILSLIYRCNVVHRHVDSASYHSPTKTYLISLCFLSITIIQRPINNSKDEIVDIAIYNRDASDELYQEEGNRLMMTFKITEIIEYRVW